MILFVGNIHRNFDYNEAIRRFRRVVAELERQLGKTLEVQTESHIQDASFHSQVCLPGGGIMRFSNFGDMISVVDEESANGDALDVAKRIVQEHGYAYIPEEVLQAPYTGENPGVTGIRDWWIRYFDWV